MGWTINPNIGITDQGIVNFPVNSGSTDKTYTITYTDEYNCTADAFQYTVPAGNCQCSCTSVTLNNTEINIGSEAQSTASTTYTVTNSICNDLVSATTNVNWLNVVVNYSSKTITLTTTEENTGAARNASVTLTMNGTPCNNKTITVTQEENIPVLPYFYITSTMGAKKIVLGNETYRENIGKNERVRISPTNNVAIKVYVDKTKTSDLSEFDITFDTKETNYYFYIDVYPYHGLGLSTSSALYEVDAQRQYGVNNDYYILFNNNGIVVPGNDSSYHENTSQSPGCVFIVDESAQEITAQIKGADASTDFITEYRGYITKTKYSVGSHTSQGYETSPIYKPNETTLYNIQIIKE